MKRLVDVSIALGVFLILLPVLVIVVVAIYCLTGRSPFFVQKRPGRNEEIFSLVKFKTMTDLKDEHGELLPDEQRITPVGAFLRKTSLDELPQMINVIKGDMSLIGPRPLLVRYLSRYTDEQRKRHILKPGITGWAQVNGRNAISWEEKFELDNYYVDNASFGLDIKILSLTLQKVLKRQDISSSTSSTMEEFFPPNNFNS